MITQQAQSVEPAKCVGFTRFNASAKIWILDCSPGYVALSDLIQRLVNAVICSITLFNVNQENNIRAALMAITANNTNVPGK